MNARTKAKKVTVTRMLTPIRELVIALMFMIMPVCGGA
jgi:hypothetical protein